MGFHTLAIGKTALMTSQLSLDVVGNNIANASTPGYSRQLVHTSALRPQSWNTNYAAGLGVATKAIHQVADQFLERQLREALSHSAYLASLDTCYSNLQVYFNEMTENDLSSALDQFWKSIGDFTTNVENTATRSQVLEKAVAVCDFVKSITTKINNYRITQNDEVIQSVAEINGHLDEIARLNREVVMMEYGGAGNVMANDLRDQRHQHLKELSELTDIHITEEPNGSFIVTQNGQLLVYYDTAYKLEVEQVKSDDMLVAMPRYSRDKSPVKAQDGRLAAQLEIRDEILLSYKQDMDAFAANFIWEMNRVQSQNTGLVGYTSLTASTRVFDATVSLDQLRYEQTPVAGTYQIVNGNVEIIVRNLNTGKNYTLNVEIDLDGQPGAMGEPDMILYDAATPNATHSLVYRVQTALDSIQPGAFEVGVDSANRFYITTTGQGYEFGFGRDSSGVLAALGMNTLFTGFNGLTMGMNETTYKNPQYLGGARAEDGDEAFVPGNNQGAWAFLNLREENVFYGKTTSLDNFYLTMVGRLGTEAARVISLRETQADVTLRMENQREELSGVNLDEELTKLIQYQRTYQSAARFITTADTLYEALLSM